MIKIKHSFLLFILFVAGCAIQAPINESTELVKQTTLNRNKQLATIMSWKIAGKIAFIQMNKRESASINWTYKEPSAQNTMQQRLDLTTLLGINVLHLSSEDNYHQIKIDGKSYYGEHLDDLISTLTGLTLPTQALTFWLKGLPHSKKDNIVYNELTNLPSSLISQYNGKTWHISYDNYQTVNHHQLATKFTISQNDLTIRIFIKRWSLNI